MCPRLLLATMPGVKRACTGRLTHPYLMTPGLYSSIRNADDPACLCIHISRTTACLRCTLFGRFETHLENCARGAGEHYHAFGRQSRFGMASYP